MKILVISPHYDDAVWSVAEHMLTWIEDGHEVAVATVFAGGDQLQPERMAAMRETAHEHTAAMLQLGVAEGYNGAFLDSGWGHHNVWDLMFTWMQETIHNARPRVIVVPSGIHHPDHVTARRLALHAKYPRAFVWEYDEIPYYVQYPHLVPPMTMRAVPENNVRPNLEAKQELCRLYASQMKPPNELERMLWVPERVWRFR